MNKFENSLRDDKNDVWRYIGIAKFISECINATLKYTEQLYFFKIFFLLVSGLYLIDKLHLRVFVDSIYLEHIGTNAIVLLRP